VEDFAVVGAGSVVMKKVRSGTTVFGVPAKDIGNLTKGVES
jgi:serine acetyltransferase